MISAISWIPKGVSKSVPLVVDPSLLEDLEEVILSNQDYDSEELEDMTIYPTDSVIVCARTEVLKEEDSDNEDSVGAVEVSILLNIEKDMYSHHGFAQLGLIAPFKERENFMAEAAAGGAPAQPQVGGPATVMLVIFVLGFLMMLLSFS